MKVLVTGGAGFIGSNLCELLVNDPVVDEVRVIDDLSTGHEENLSGLPVSLAKESILDTAALEAAADGVDAIVHLAALGSVPRSVADPLTSHNVNATGTLNVLEVARRNSDAHVVLASSSSVYGANPVLPKSEDLACLPMSPYAVSKLATEQYAMAYAQCYGLPVLPFRFFNVYGPKQRAEHVYAAVIPRFMDAAVNGRPLTVHGSGEQSRDFTFVGTVTQVIAAALRNRVTSTPCNLAFGTTTSLLDLIQLLEELIGHPLAAEHTDIRPGDVKHSQANNELLLSLFPGVRAESLEHGLAGTLEWMTAAYKA